jgi:5'-methylthioinosine phosphorylase
MGRHIALIGGSGLYQLEGIENIRVLSVDTPYGQTSADLIIANWLGQPIVFLPRHGEKHKIPPHKINYRANIWALKQQDVSHIIAVNAVGGISPDMAPGKLVIPDQIIDYSSGREHTFFDGSSGVEHIDFTHPYDIDLRQQLVELGEYFEPAIVAGGIYGCTNGPRFESAGEIRRLGQDGCNIVGMTGMPEAALARELGIAYASISIVVNWAAGVTSETISMNHIMDTLNSGIDNVRRLLASFFEKRIYELL